MKKSIIEDTELEMTSKKPKQFSKASIKNIIQTIILLIGIICIIYGSYTLISKDNKQSISYDTIETLYSYIFEVWPSSPFHEEKVESISDNTLFSSIIKEKCNETLCNIEKSYVDNEILKKYNKILKENRYYYNGIECNLNNDIYECKKDDSIYEINNTNLQMLYTYKKVNDTIEIYDLYLNYSDKCYLDNSKKYSCLDTFINDKDKLNSVELLNKYGQKYKHVFEKENDNYYWKYSEIVK